MAGSRHISRRDFIKLATFTVGGAIGAAVGIPGIVYLIDPALGAAGKDAWVPLGPLENFPVGGPPTLVTFVRSKVNGWEKTSNSYGVFIIRKSEEDVLVLSNRCTHLSCRVNWSEEKEEFICPCHDAAFDREGEVVSGPPPEPLDRYTGETIKIEEGVLSILFTEG